MRFFRYAFLLIFIILSGCSYVTKTMTSPFRSFRHSFTEHKQSYWDRYGKVYYLDGAGNMGFGEETVPKALRSSGFRGDVENISWTTHTGPLGDQMIRANARYRAENMTKKIIEYRNRYPQAPIYIISLSAGTGVAVWAVENLPSDLKVDSIVLLGSSLSTRYNMSRCLKHVSNKVFVFYSPRDYVLKSFIPVTGTIDGEFFTDPAGMAGLYPPVNPSREELDLYKEKLENIAWRPSFERLGNAGGHTDGTSYRFVKYYIAKRMGIGRYAQSND
ncbi:MAG: hypothetical protein WC975_13610 [Phycisphaerae bacterium]